MSEKLKEFYGSVSLTARVSFFVKAEDKEAAENAVFDEMECIQVVLKDGTKLEISEIDWDLIHDARRGNVMQPNISNFEIYEEEE